MNIRWSIDHVDFYFREQYCQRFHFGQMSHLTCEENPKALSSPDIRGNKNSREHISAIQDLFRSLTRSKARVYIFAMRPRIYFNPFHVIHLYVSPTSFDLISIYGIFHSLPDVLKIFQIQFDRSLVNIAFSADSLPFEPINFQFQLSSLEGNHLYLLLNCAHKTKHFLTTIDNFWRKTEVDLSWIKGLCQLSIKSRTRKMSRNLTFGIDVEIIDDFFADF